MWREDVCNGSGDGVSENGRAVRTNRLSIAFQHYQIVLENIPVYSIRSTDNANSFDREYILTDDNCQFSSRHGLSILTDNKPVASCIFLSGGGASGVHEHSAIVVGNNCYVAVGPFICCIKLPSLDLAWSACVDSATCFGVYNSTKHLGLISHGELEIARLSYAGEIIWTQGGKDIFSESIEMHEDFVIATDFNGQKYRFDIVTGKGVLPDFQPNDAAHLRLLEMPFPAIFRPWQRLLVFIRRLADWSSAILTFLVGSPSFVGRACLWRHCLTIWPMDFRLTISWRHFLPLHAIRRRLCCVMAGSELRVNWPHEGASGRVRSCSNQARIAWL